MTPVPAQPQSLRDLFWSFNSLALHGFGGVLPWAHRVLVQQKRWLTPAEFVELLALAQLLPGPNIVNVAVMIGARHFGWRGSVVAVLGMVAMPAMLVLAVAILYSQFVHLPAVRGALAGMAAVAAGLVIATALKLAIAQRRHWISATFAAAAFIGVGLLRYPLPWVLAALAPLAFVAAWLELGRARPPSQHEDRAD
ncbi:MAG TPA: chromate transporter [Burkholderiaceae bacterium]|nr:chromate transporter [Burkholderiaceae bacterium]